MQRIENPGFDAETVKAVLDQVEKDSKTLDHQATELYAETDAKVVEAAKALKSLGLFPRQRVVDHTPTSTFAYAYMDLLTLGEPSTTRPFLHSDGSIVLHRVPWEGRKDEDRIVAPEYSEIIAPKRFPYAREALTRIQWLLESALRDNQPAETAPQPSSEDLPF